MHLCGWSDSLAVHAGTAGCAARRPPPPPDTTRHSSMCCSLCQQGLGAAVHT